MSWGPPEEYQAAADESGVRDVRVVTALRVLDEPQAPAGVGTGAQPIGA